MFHILTEGWGGGGGGGGGGITNTSKTTVGKLLVVKCSKRLVILVHQYTKHTTSLPGHILSARADQGKGRNTNMLCMWLRLCLYVFC